MANTVRDLMTTEVETLSPESSMEEAVQLEMRRKIRHIPILEDGKLVGILTDRDLKRAMPSLLTGTARATHEKVIRTTRVSQIMTRSPLTVTSSTLLKDAVRVLCERKFGALPVVDGGRLVGILSETDVLRAFLARLEKET